MFAYEQGQTILRMLEFLINGSGNGKRKWETVKGRKVPGSIMGNGRLNMETGVGMGNGKGKRKRGREGKGKGKHTHTYTHIYIYLAQFHKI